jgi:signal transduction histidine kinase/phage shock protein PspC (stress-responsive transcriptional regulator)
VAGGLSERYGIDATVIRVALVLSALVSGIGVVGYVIAWLLFPVDDEQGTIGSRAVSDRKGLLVVVALLPVLVAVLVVGSALDAGYLSSVAWAVYLSAGGLILVYRNADDAERVWLHRVAEPVMHLGSASARSRRALIVRVVGGSVLLSVGLVLLVLSHSSRVTLDLLGGVVLMIAAIVVIFGPWWLRLTRDLVSERQARIRAEERADMAARVHDSVLQTLALIQRSAAQPDRVVQLARTQERDLRSWLFEGRPPGSIGADGAGTLAAALEQVAREVEAAHGVPVDVVVVGDCPLDDDLRMMLAAGREATVNSAKWSGASTVSIFAEVEAQQVSMFVRDRGTGFDPDVVAEDRQGIATSIRARMGRVGGAVIIRSIIGQGTEIELTVPRSGART